MAVKPPISKLGKSKSQEFLDQMDTPSSPSSVFTSKMRKVFQSSPILKKKTRTASSNPSTGISKTFGVPLTQLLTTQGQNDSRKLSLPVVTKSITQHKIPPVVTKIVNHIETHGLDQEGIYRINGNNKVVERLKIIFNEIGDADLHDIDIYSIGSLLKLFLRMLPTPLVPDDVSHRVIKLQESLSTSSGGSYTSEDTTKLKDILATLPNENLRLLKYLCDHLFRVSEYKSQNRMTSVSLSIVFGPNIFRCGGEMIDLKNQGYANSALAHMIRCHDTIFDHIKIDNTINEIDELKAISTASDDVFTSNDDLPIQQERKKPNIPIPYHEHKLQHMAKTKSTTSSQGSVSLPSSPVHHDNNDIHVIDNYNDPVSPTSERSIDEAIAEAEVEKNKQTETSSVAVNVPKLIKNKSLSDDILTNRGPSPSSWNSKSSPGTSPATTPPLTPRTSQAYTTLLGDSIQDHLFTPESHKQQPLRVVRSTEDHYTEDTTEIPYQVLPSSSEATTTPSVKSEGPASTSNESVQSRDFSVRRRSNARRNRKSAVYGSDSSLEGNTASGVMHDTNSERKDYESIELYTVNESATASISKQELNVTQLTTNDNTENENTDWEKESTTQPSAKSIRDAFEKKGFLFQFAGKDTPIKALVSKDKVSTEDNTSTVVKRTPPQVAKKPIRKSLVDDTQQQMNIGDNYVAHDFDHVTEKVKTLTHLTKQRVRGPHNRARPSRLSSSGSTDISVSKDNSIDMIDAASVITNTVISNATDYIASSINTVSVNDSITTEVATTPVTDTPSIVTQMTPILPITNQVMETPSITTPVMATIPITTTTTTETVTGIPSDIKQVTPTPSITIPVTETSINEVAATPVTTETAITTQVIETPSITTPPVIATLSINETIPVTTEMASSCITQAIPSLSTTTATPITSETAGLVTSTIETPITSKTATNVTTPIETPITSKTVTNVTTPIETPIISTLETPVTMSDFPITTPISQVMIAPQVIATTVPTVPVMTQSSAAITQKKPSVTTMMANTLVQASLLNAQTTLTQTPTSLVMTAVPIATLPQTSTQNILILSPVTTSSHHTVVLSNEPSGSGITELSPSHQQQIGPVHSISLVPAGWTTDENEFKDLSYEELITKARKLKQIIQTFHDNFLAQNGRKPTNEETLPVANETSSLTRIKKELRALRSKQRDTLNKTAPPQIITNKIETPAMAPTNTAAIIQEEEPLTSFSAVKIDDTLNDVYKRTDATVRRHQSLSIPLSHSRQSAFSLLIQGIQKGLQEKREEAGRPEKLEEMSYDQVLQEKHLIQKTLLNFEKKHGKPQSSENKVIIKPLYNRYRQIKQILSSRNEKEITGPVNSTSGGGVVGINDRSLFSVSMLPATPPPSAPPHLSSFTTSSATRDYHTTTGFTTTTRDHHITTGLTTTATTTHGIRRDSPPAIPPITTTEGILMGKRGRFMSTGTITGNSGATSVLRTSNSKKKYSKSVSQILPSAAGSSWMTDEQLQNASIGELREQLVLTQTRKREQREKLRLFEIGFREREKRPVQNDDKKRLMHSEYTYYKNLKNRLSLLDTLIARQGMQTTM